MASLTLRIRRVSLFVTTSLLFGLFQDKEVRSLLVSRGSQRTGLEALEPVTVASEILAFITQQIFVAVYVLAVWAYFTRQETEAKTIATIKAQS